MRFQKYEVVKVRITDDGWLVEFRSQSEPSQFTYELWNLEWGQVPEPGKVFLFDTDGSFKTGFYDHKRMTLRSREDYNRATQKRVFEYKQKQVSKIGEFENIRASLSQRFRKWLDDIQKGVDDYEFLREGGMLDAVVVRDAQKIYDEYRESSIPHYKEGRAKHCESWFAGLRSLSGEQTARLIPGLDVDYHSYNSLSKAWYIAKYEALKDD